MSARSNPGWPASLLVFSGHARFPKESAAGSVYEMLAIAVTVEQRHGVIVDVDATLVTQPAKIFVRNLLLGVSLNDPPEPVTDYLVAHYHGGAKKVILAAVRDVYDRWEEISAEYPPE